ncbi:anti-sigma factor [Nocardioides sp. Root1257]|uniref:anti-sigma factor n=1 Tax=unclassified Nocardioides TaxID=2615069 RepID=UPI0006FDAB40|nr:MULTISPECIES: anti-sigma factor [unclassified Nocardioides]KQW47779.1 anti-sigma factor [Nocardioides sp. Root1257]KRC45031.1 anti-sigma factor [Nocardioides sp. Root224]
MTTPNDIHALVGAYAVDALDDLERVAFERHLAGCDECQDEVTSLREAAGLLAETTSTQPPAALRDRVLADIATVRPLPPEAPTAAPAASAPHRRHGRGARLLAAAAAVVVLGAGATVVWQEPWQDSTSETPSVTDAVLTAADARSTSLDFPGGAKATVTHSDSLGEAVIVTEKMPPPPAGKVYQLWLDQPGEGMVSAGLMPVKADQTVLLKGDAATATGAGITVEPEGGSTSPTTEPIALFDFGDKA